ncbi:MAG: Gfo/Idh/MocA family oxidoreductase [Erysipelotrichales bacterium]|nr:Gfo/Idh/MocA family oxidoreductase [Erysipelotrichales bacterium]
MRLGILGTGMIVKDFMTMVHELNIDYISILGTKEREEETKELVQKYHLNQYFYDYDELLNDDIDTVYVALPNHLHFQFAKKALESGKNVIIEKPITSNAKELSELITIANQRHLMIFEAMNIHYLPAFKALKKDISKVGNIKIVYFNYSQYSSRYNAFKEGNILPAFDYKKSGGALMDINVYNIHAIMGLFKEPKESYYFANIENNIDTSGMMVLNYENYKAVCIGAKDCQAPIISTIQGDEGVIVIEKPVNQIVGYKFIDNHGDETEYCFDEGKHRLFYEFKEFIRMIEEKDYQTQQDMLQLSLEIAEVMEKGRKQEGVIFGNERS